MSDAITRKEAYLKSIGNGTSSALKPITREEQYLAYIAGESKSFPTTPITREEAFLDKIAKKGAGGGGSSINVQPLTVTENGTWDAPEGQAYDPVTVDVKPITEPITITENGVYPVPKGGGLEYGKTVKFKNVTDDDMYTLIDNLGLQDNLSALYTILAVDTNRMLAMLVGADYSALYFQTLDINNNNNLIASYVLSFSDLKWFDGITQEELSSPPTITILPDAPPEPQYELSQFEPLFDIETKSLDGWGDITVNVAGGGDGDFYEEGMAKFVISIRDVSERSVQIRFRQGDSRAVRVDWGDGSEAETYELDGNGQYQSHLYDNVGTYVIKLIPLYNLEVILGITGAMFGLNPNVLRKVYLGHKQLKFYNSAFSGSINLDAVDLSVFDNYSLGFKASVFRSCSRLANVAIPEGVTSVGEGCFSACGQLLRVTFPSTITSIGASAFQSCASLKVLDFSKSTSVPTLTATNAIGNVAGLQILIPSALYDEWTTATNWASSYLAEKYVAV